MNRYRDHELTPIEVAAIQNEIDRLNQGVWTSETERNASLRSPGYHTEGPIGRLFQHAWEQKCIRTQEAGYSLLGNNRVVDNHGDHHAAVAFKDADGNIQVESRDFSNMHDAPASQQTNEDADDNNKPRIESFPGGALRVSLNRKSLPFVTSSPAAEKKAREEYLRK